MDTTILILTVLTLIAAALSAIFAYPAWRENRRRVALRLGLPYARHHPDQHTLTVVDTGDSARHQVVFGLALWNDGNREARNWRVWFGSRQQGTMLSLSAAFNDPRFFLGPTYGGGRWFNEVLAGGPSDIVTPRAHAPLTLGSSHTLNFQGDPTVLDVDYRLDADGMPTRAGVLRLEIDWTTRTARFHFTPR